MTIQPVPPTTGPTTAGQLAARATANDNALAGRVTDLESRSGTYDPAILRTGMALIYDEATENWTPNHVITPRGTVPAGTDLNSLSLLLHSGLWRISAGDYPNGPATIPSSGVLEVLRVDAVTVVQRITVALADESATRMWWREAINLGDGRWGPWAEASGGTASITVNGKAPVDGNIALTASDVGALVGPVTPYDATFFDAPSNRFDAEKITPGHVISAGAATPTPNANYNVSAPIPVTDGQPYSYNGVLRITYFDAAGNYVHYHDANRLPTTRPATAGSSYVRLSVHRQDLDTVAQMNAGEALLPYEPGATPMLKAEFLPDSPGPGPDPTPTGPQYVLDSPGLAETYDGPTLTDMPTYAEAQATLTADVYGWYDDLVAAHPDYVTRTDLGAASDGQRLYSYTLRPPLVPTRPDGGTSSSVALTPGPSALLISGVHGYEKAAVWHLWRMAKALCEEWADSPVLDAIRWNIEVVIVPVGNPYSYDNSIIPTENVRTNANGVDIARNFTPGWAAGTPGTGTWGGTGPLTEPEAIILDQLMQDMASRCVFGSSFHNFNGNTTSNNHVIWQAAASDLTLRLGKRLVARMSRKWRTDHAWITDPRPYYGYADLEAPGGSEGRAMESHGIPGATFETSRNQYLDGGTGGSHSDRAMTLGYEATVNYVAMGIHAGLNRP